MCCEEVAPTSGGALRGPGWLRALAPGWVLAWSHGRGERQKTDGRLRKLTRPHPRAQLDAELLLSPQSQEA